MCCYILVIAVAAIVVLAFSTIKVSFDNKTLKEAIKDKDAKYHSLLSYIETLKAPTKPKKSTKKS